MAFEFLMPDTVLYGKGAFDDVGKQAARYGKKALVISDPVMDSLGIVKKCKTFLQEYGLTVVSYVGVDSEPTNVHVDEAVEICSQNSCDVIIGLGGGSCIDTAKAVAVLIPNGGVMSDYYATDRSFTKRSLPVIAIPTTAGTGSEVTKVTVITDTASGVKMMFSNRQLLPKVAIVDPVLTLSCPANVTAATGMDALCHAIEAYISKRAQPITDTLALTAIDNIFSSIRRAYEKGNDENAREKMSLGSMLAGAAFSNASVTLVHGMSRPIGALFKVPHGISNAMLLPAVLEYTKAHAKKRLADIGRKMTNDTNVSDSELADLVIREVKQLCLDLNIPNLKTYGINETDFRRALPKMAKDAIISGSPGNNPIVPTEEEIIALYERCYDYDFSTSNEHV